MSTPLSARSARRRLMLLTATRWLPVGLCFGLTTLLPLQRGLSLTQVAAIMAVQGFIVLGLELPTGGLADAIGRRTLLVAAALTATVSSALFLAASTFGAFVAAMALQGVFRALDSGPLEAWYVDTAQADDPTVAVEAGLSGAATVLGVAIAGGALISGGLVAWHPWASTSPLVLPFVLATLLYGVHAGLTAWLVREPPVLDHSPGLRSALTSARQAPRVVVAGVRTLRADSVLRSLVLVEVFWSVGMIAFETLNPVRLTELVGSEDRAGALYGPAAAAAWALFALGAAVGGLTSRRLGVAWTALIARVLNGGFVVVMGLAAGPVGLIGAYWLTYCAHGAAGPVHSTLLHRQARPGNRATVLSMNSMVAGGSYSLGLLVLGPLAQHTSTATAMIVAGSFSVLGALLYLPAIRAERTPSAEA